MWMTIPNTTQHTAAVPTTHPAMIPPRLSHAAITLLSKYHSKYHSRNTALVKFGESLRPVVMIPQKISSAELYVQLYAKEKLSS